MDYDTLKMVSLAASEKDLVPAFKCFYFYENEQGGTSVQCTDGHVMLDAEIEIERTKGMRLPMCVEAESFVQALNVTEDQDLKFEKQKVRLDGQGIVVTLPLMDPQDYPPVNVMAEKRRAKWVRTPYLLDALLKLRPFVSKDASRPWSQSVLLDGDCAYATNNVCLVEHKIPVKKSMPTCVLPVCAVELLLNVGHNKSMWLDDWKHVWFMWQNGLTARCSLLDHEWPNVREMLDGAEWKHLVDVPPQLLPAVRSIVPFNEDQRVPILELCGAGVRTAEGNKEALYTGYTLDKPARFRGEVLVSVLEVARRWAIQQYPNPVPFTGQKLRGMFVGIRP